MLSPARAVAFDILLRVERDRAYATELLHSDRLRDLPEADRGLCMQLVMGVLRWRSRLDLALGALSSEPLPKLDLEVLIALRLAAYQIGFLERIPARAAVNESVELVKRARKRSAAALVNAVLRRLAARRELLEPVLPPGPKTVFDLEQMYSHPLWLVERWAAQFGMADAERICAYDQGSAANRDSAARSRGGTRACRTGPATGARPVPAQCPACCRGRRHPHLGIR